MITGFWREGKKMSYGEFTDAFGQMISKEILTELDTESLEKIYVKSFESAYNAMKDYLETKNYKVINCKQAILTAQKVKLINDSSTWQTAWQIKEAIVNDYAVYEEKYQADMTIFIKETYYPALKSLREKIEV